MNRWFQWLLLDSKDGGIKGWAEREIEGEGDVPMLSGEEKSREIEM
jgi:hypothetical protein